MLNLQQKFKDLLIWSQKYTKTDMLYLAKGGFWLSLGQVISLVASFALSLAFANLMPPEVYGTYRYVLSIFGILAIPTLAGLNISLNRAVARGYDGSAREVLKTKITWGVLGGIGGLAVALFYYLHGNTQLMICFLIAAAFLPFMDSFDIYGAILHGKKDFKTATKYSIIPQIIAASVMIATLVLTKNIYFIILAYFVSWTTLRFIFLKLALRNVKLNGQKDPNTISYGKHLSLMGIIAIIAAYFDRLLVFHYWGAVEVAIYSIAIAPPEQIKGVLSNIHNLAFPKFAQRADSEIRAGMKGKFIRSFLLGVLVVGAYIVTAPYIYHFFFPKYSASIFLSQLFSLSLLNISFGPAETYLSAKMKVKELYFVNTFTPIFQIIIMALFTIWQGLIGLIIARIITRYVGTLLNLFFYHRSASDTTLESPELVP